MDGSPVTLRREFGLVPILKRKRAVWPALRFLRQSVLPLRPQQEGLSSRSRLRCG